MYLSLFLYAYKYINANIYRYLNISMYGYMCVCV